MKKATLSIYVVLATFAVVSVACKNSDSGLSEDSASKVKVVLGPKDGATDTYIYLASAPVDVPELYFCTVDPASPSEECVGHSMFKMLPAKTQQTDVKFYQTEKGQPAFLNMKLRLYAMKNEKEPIFVEKFFLVDPSGANQGNWKAVIISGDATFNNAREELKKAVVAKGVAAVNVKELLAGSGLAAELPSVANIKAAFTALNLAADDGCFLYLGSKGSQADVTLGAETLTPAQLDEVLTAACGGRATVAIVSASYSGKFLSAKKANRIILTATNDASVVSTQPPLLSNEFDVCLAKGIADGATWKDFSASLATCAKSSPQSDLGASVAAFGIFKDSKVDAGSNPDPALDPETSAPNLGDKDVTFKNGKKLSELFGSAKYAWIDVSRLGCGYCYELAAMIEQAKLDKNKCATVTVIPVGETAGWKQTVGAAAGVHAVEYSNPGAVKGKFGGQMTGTPSSIVIDRQGKAVADWEGAAIGNFVKQNCK